jgi:hypothetical protein
MVVERGVQQGLHKLREVQQIPLHFVWGNTLYHLDDKLFMPMVEFHDIYTQFWKVFLMYPHHLHNRVLMI